MGGEPAMDPLLWKVLRDELIRMENQRMRREVRETYRLYTAHLDEMLSLPPPPPPEPVRPPNMLEIMDAHIEQRSWKDTAC